VQYWWHMLLLQSRCTGLYVHIFGYRMLYNLPHFTMYSLRQLSMCSALECVYCMQHMYNTYYHNTVKVIESKAQYLRLLVMQVMHMYLIVCTCECMAQRMCCTLTGWCAKRLCMTSCMTYVAKPCVMKHLLHVAPHTALGYRISLMQLV
jgi:hypothetical protein